MYLCGMIEKGNNVNLVARCLMGMEPVLADELRNMGAMFVKEGRRAVEFSGDLGTVYKANFQLRTALSVLVPIKSFRIRDEKDLYKQLLKIEWENILPKKKSISVEPVVFSKMFSHTLYAAQLAKDAIVDRMREANGFRPDVDVKNPQVPIVLKIAEDKVDISLNSSGHSLHKRGYRKQHGKANLNECLAAGMILHTKWRGDVDLFDPMCGSGTLLAEAAMIAANIPAGLHREEYAFMNWPGFDKALWETIRERAIDRIQDFPAKIYGWDKRPTAVKEARENLESAELKDFVHLQITDFIRSFAPVEKGMIITNPPYNKKIETDAPRLYESIGDTLKQGWPGFRAFILTGYENGHKYFGLKTKSRTDLMNGPIECKYLEYELYEGTKKFRSEEQLEAKRKAATPRKPGEKRPRLNPSSPFKRKED